MCENKRPFGVPFVPTFSIPHQGQAGGQPQAPQSPVHPKRGLSLKVVVSSLLLW